LLLLPLLLPLPLPLPLPLFPDEECETVGADCTGAGWGARAEEWLEEAPADDPERWLVDTCGWGAGAEASVIADAGGTDLCFGLAMGFGRAGFAGVVAVVVVLDVVVVTGAATRVELVCETLPQPATATAASVMGTSARFINPTPVFARLPAPQGTRHFSERFDAVLPWRPIVAASAFCTMGAP
jgi:hypothetical protein